MKLPKCVEDKLEECRKAYREWVDIANRELGEKFTCYDDDECLIYEGLCQLTARYKRDIKQVKELIEIERANE